MKTRYSVAVANVEVYVEDKRGLPITGLVEVDAGHQAIRKKR